MQSDDAISMLMTMASMQEEHNAQVHPQWKDQGYEYYRAIWVECAEMLDHFGWKWWKNQEPDIDQVKLELVDIWHFALSELIRSEQLHESLGAELANVEPIDSTPEIFREAIESLAISSLQSRSFKMSDFTYAMRTLPMDLKELFQEIIYFLLSIWLLIPKFLPFDLIQHHKDYYKTLDLQNHHKILKMLQ